MTLFKCRVLKFLFLFFLLGGCGKVLNQKSFSQVSGLNLSWNNQQNIRSFNTANYPFSGVCADGFGDVTVSFGLVLQTVVPCIDSEFTGSVDLTTAGLVNGEDLTLRATQVGIPIEAVITPEINFDLLGLPTILSLSEGSTVLASTQTISGGCEPGATVNITSGVQGGPLSTTCSPGGTYSINAILTQPDGAKTIRANQENGPGTASPDAAVNLILSPFGLRVNANSSVGYTVGLGIELLSGSNWSIDWGDGTVDTGLTSGIAGANIVTHTYSSDYIGRVRLENVVETDIIRMRITSGGWAYDISDLPSALLEHDGYTGASRNTVTGNLADLPSTIQEFRLSGNNLVTGDVADIPASLYEIRLGGQNTVSGLVGNLKEGVNRIRFEGNNTLSGDVANFPSTLAQVTIAGVNTVMGDIANFQPALRSLNIGGNNTVSGNLNNIGGATNFFSISGNNTITGSYADLPAVITDFTIQGNNTTSGNIDDFGPNIETIRIGGGAVFGGDVANSPPGLRILIINIDSTIGGDMASLPDSVSIVQLRYENFVTGDVAGLPLNLREFIVQGSNTLFGSINSLPPNTNYFAVEGNNTINATGTTWNSATTGVRYFGVLGDGPRSQADIDNILVSLTSITSWAGSSTVNLQGVNDASPSAIGNAAITTILSNGCTNVRVN